MSSAGGPPDGDEILALEQVVGCAEPLFGVGDIVDSLARHQMAAQNVL